MKALPKKKEQMHELAIVPLEGILNMDTFADYILSEKNCIKKSYHKRADTLFKQQPTCETTTALLPFTST